MAHIPKVFKVTTSDDDQGDPQKLKKYLTADVINFKHPYTGDNCLHCAVSSPFPKRKAIVETLCRKGCNLNEKNKEFLTPLHVATDKSHYDGLELLQRLGQTGLPPLPCH